MAFKDNARCVPIARTGRVQDWLDAPSGRLPVSCTTFVVEDAMEGENGIEASWRFVSHGLRNGAGVSIHLSKLRAEGEDNGKGLIASGPVSFAMIYSKLNEILRRGGRYKNGAITLHLDYDHPDAIKFITAPRSALPWAKRCLNVDQNLLTNSTPELIQALLKGIASGDLWLMKMKTDSNGARIYGNVCVAGSTLVQTTEGPIPIADLVGKPFTAVVNGKEAPSSPRGAWSNGFAQTYTLTTEEGHQVRATRDHRIATEGEDGGLEWKTIMDLAYALDKEPQKPQIVYVCPSSLEPAKPVPIKSINYCWEEEVFDCSIPQFGYFAANGIIVSNCLEVLLPHRGTCLLQHVNLGAMPLDESAFVDTFKEGMTQLCQLHAKTGVDDSGEYLAASLDRQVGLGLLGLANFLSIHGISYEDFGKALQEFMHGDSKVWDENWHNTPAGKAVYCLNDGIEAAMYVAHSYGMERAFAIAPTASCSYRHLDTRGYTTAPEIAPPIARLVDRDSSTFEVETFDYGPVEIASEVGWENYKRVADGIVSMMQATGLFHGYSFNWWSDAVQCDEAFLREWLLSPQTSLYYALPVMPNTQAKDDAYVALDDDFKQALGLTESKDEEPKNHCSVCAE